MKTEHKRVYYFQGWKLVKHLFESGMIVRVPNDGGDETNPLDPTEERMIFDRFVEILE